MTWNDILKKYPEANFSQSPAWAKTNELTGHKVITEFFEAGGYALMIVRNAKRGRYLEIPCGPLLDWQNHATVDAAFTRIRQIAVAEKCVFVRFRPQLPKTTHNLDLMVKLGARPSPMHLAAEHTVMLDLTAPEETLLANMRRQTRYEVRRAEKQGIAVAKSNSEATFREFHNVQLATARRQNFIPPDLKTLLAERTAFGDNAVIYKATVNSEPIAYGLILTDGIEAAYYEAASTDLNRKLPGAYALIWQAMRDLKKQGIERFNLWGIAPPNQPHHRYAGVTTFKTGFGGEVIEYLPAHDIVVNKPKYLKNLIVETIRKKRRHL